MKLKDFEYHLPQELIAQYPLFKRDEARLMVVERKTGRISHDVFSNIEKYLPAQSLLILNDSKVIPARLLGCREKTGGKVEVFLLNRLCDGYTFEALIRPWRRLKVNEKIIFNGSEIYAQLKDPIRRIVRFNMKNIFPYLKRIGHVPLPPYIKRMDEPLDKKYYQTVYARHPGSVASPTAGLHFTELLLNRLKNKGHVIKKVTLHVNYATFKPVEEEDITKHKMHSENYSVSKKSWDAIRNARLEQNKIVAVGTTSSRVLETVAATGKLKDETRLFIYPGYEFRMTDILITNFHLPKSTLFMLVCAFASRDLMIHAYEEAIGKRYRFYSYGDGMVII